MIDRKAGATDSPVELHDRDIENATGGTARKIDASSPKLLLTCCTGKHVKSASL